MQPANLCCMQTNGGRGVRVACQLSVKATSWMGPCSGAEPVALLPLTLAGVQFEIRVGIRVDSQSAWVSPGHWGSAKRFVNRTVNALWIAINQSLGLRIAHSIASFVANSCAPA